MPKQIHSDVVAFLTKLGYEFSTTPQIPSNIFDRIDHLGEELDETLLAANDNNLEEVIDGLVDLIYIAAGTIAMCGTTLEPHWNAVQKANISKERGMTKRGHSFDALKPDGWEPPNHKTILINLGWTQND